MHEDIYLLGEDSLPLNNKFCFLNNYLIYSLFKKIYNSWEDIHQDLILKIIFPTRCVHMFDGILDRQDQNLMKKVSNFFDFNEIIEFHRLHIYDIVILYNSGVISGKDVVKHTHRFERNISFEEEFLGCFNGETGTEKMNEFLNGLSKEGLILKFLNPDE